MSIDTLGYVKHLTAAGFEREKAEAQAEALRDHLVPQLATSTDLDKLSRVIEASFEKQASQFEAMLWKHSLAIVASVIAAGGFLLRFAH